MVISFLIIYCNIGLPNALKGFLFFIQVAIVIKLATYMCIGGEVEGEVH